MSPTVPKSIRSNCGGDREWFLLEGEGRGDEKGEGIGSLAEGPCISPSSPRTSLERKSLRPDEKEQFLFKEAEGLELRECVFTSCQHPRRHRPTQPQERTSAHEFTCESTTFSLLLVLRHRIRAVSSKKA